MQRSTHKINTLPHPEITPTIISLPFNRAHFVKNELKQARDTYHKKTSERSEKLSGDISVKLRLQWKKTIDALSSRLSLIFMPNFTLLTSSPPPFSFSSQAECCFISGLPGPLSRKSRNFGCHKREVPAGFVFLVVSTTQVEVTWRYAGSCQAKSL